MHSNHVNINEKKSFKLEHWIDLHLEFKNKLFIGNLKKIDKFDKSFQCYFKIRIIDQFDTSKRKFVVKLLADPKKYVNTFKVYCDAQTLNVCSEFFVLIYFLIFKRINKQFY